MVEPVGGDSLATATDPDAVGIETVAEEAQPEQFTIGELSALVDKALQARLDAHWRGLEGRFQSLEEKAKATQEALGDLGTVKRLSERMTKATLTPDEYEAMQQEEEAQSLKERLDKAEKGQKQWQDVAVQTIQQQDQQEWQAAQNRLAAYGKGQGLASIVQLSFPGERVPTPNDPRGWHSWEEAAQEVIDAEVERLAQLAKPVAPITTQRPAGDTGAGLQSLVNKAGAGADLTAAEMAQVAKALAEGYTVKRSR